MSRRVAVGLLLLLVQLSLASASAQGNTVPYGLDAMLQLDRLPYLKSGTVAGGQSSYDRSGANKDFSNFLYTDSNGDQVLLDLAGPGTVYRMWFTGFVPWDARLKVYFDGESSPRLDMLLSEMVAGDHAPFLAPLVGNAEVSSGGAYSYVPLPFNHSIKITTSQHAPRFFYQIGYHLYSPGTPIATWTPSQDSSPVRTLWQHAGIDPKNNENALVSGSMHLAAGARQTLLDVAGPRSISSIKLRIPGLAANMSYDIWIQVYWDDQVSPSVSAPLGSFFAMGQFGVFPTRSLMLGQDDAGALYAYFPMPFQRRARIELLNRGVKDLGDAQFEIKHARFADSFANLGYFTTAFVSQTVPAHDGKEMVLLDVRGAGHLVGFVGSFTGPPDGSFMEGNEHIFVDEAETPIIQGTGVEDFFNGGFYFEQGLFTLPVHGHTAHAGADGLDRIAAYRLFLQDAIPFRTRLQLTMEHGIRNSARMDAATLAFLYLRPLNGTRYY